MPRKKASSFEKKDASMDKKTGVKENGKRDLKLDTMKNAFMNRGIK